MWNNLMRVVAGAVMVLILVVGCAIAIPPTDRDYTTAQARKCLNEAIYAAGNSDYTRNFLRHTHPYDRELTTLAYYDHAGVAIDEWPDLQEKVNKIGRKYC